MKGFSIVFSSISQLAYISKSFFTHLSLKTTSHPCSKMKWSAVGVNYVTKQKYHMTSISCNEFWGEHLGFFPTCQVIKNARWIYIVTGCWGWTCQLAHPAWVRATSHTRPRAHDHYTSSTLIGGKGGASPSSLHIALEGPTEHVTARWM